jgi:hypothetical protein
LITRKELESAIRQSLLAAGVKSSTLSGPSWQASRFNLLFDENVALVDDFLSHLGNHWIFGLSGLGDFLRKHYEPFFAIALFETPEQLLSAMLLLLSEERLPSVGTLMVQHFLDSRASADRLLLSSRYLSLFDMEPRSHRLERSLQVLSLSGAHRRLVRVFYATDRARTTDASVMGDQSQGIDVHYCKIRSKGIDYGECIVSVPAVHKIGQLESPSVLRLEFRPDLTKHIVLVQATSMEDREFLERVSSSVMASTAKEAFVFVHGYKRFFRGCRSQNWSDCCRFAICWCAYIL